MLTKKIDELNEEKALLLSEIDALKCKMREGENARADSNADINKQMQRMQQKLDAMQQELYKLKTKWNKRVILALFNVWRDHHVTGPLHNILKRYSFRSKTEVLV